MSLTPEKIYNILINKFGNQNWWPVDLEYHIIHNSDPRFEIIVGALLTQNTAWLNVEKSLINLKKHKKLSINDICNIDINFLEKLIRPSGFFKQKSTTLKNISYFINNGYDNKLDDFFNRRLIDIRKDLISIRGIGPETADTILLYAGDKPIFVVDKYTKRLCIRLPLEVEIENIKIQSFFQNNLKNNLSTNKIVNVYKEFHALIVGLCKKFCKKQPDCINCIIKENCSYCNFYFNKL